MLTTAFLLQPLPGYVGYTCILGNDYSADSLQMPFPIANVDANVRAFINTVRESSLAAAAAAAEASNSRKRPRECLCAFTRTSAHRLSIWHHRCPIGDDQWPIDRAQRRSVVPRRAHRRSVVIGVYRICIVPNEPPVLRLLAHINMRRMTGRNAWEHTMF